MISLKPLSRELWYRTSCISRQNFDDALIEEEEEEQNNVTSGFCARAGNEDSIVFEFSPVTRDDPRRVSLNTQAKLPSAHSFI